MSRLFRWRRRSDIVLGIVDLFQAALVCWIAYLLRFQGLPPLASSYAADYLAISLGVAFAFPVTARARGLYRRAALRPGESNLQLAFEAAAVVTVAVLIIDQAALHGRVSRGWILLVGLLLLLFALASRALLRRVRRALVPVGVGLERYAVVGDGPDAARLVRDLTRASGAPYEVVGTFPPTDVGHAVAEARRLRLDGLILPVESEGLAAKLASQLAGSGIDLLLAPRLGQLDVRVTSIAMLHGVPLLRAAGLTPRRRAVRSSVGSLQRGVAILGTRGIPANYGGFETFAERLALCLTDEAVPVTVYCRRHHATAGAQWQGIRLVTLPTVRNKYLDTVVHTALSALHLVLRTRVRKVILCNAANAPVLPLLRLSGRDVIMNVDGLEWRRGKWGIAGRSWYRMGEWLSVRLASALVTDADEVRTYYRVRHDTDSVMIPYGADLLERGLPLPQQLDVHPDEYVLYVSRWEPENNPELVAAAHSRSGVEMPMVMLGSVTYGDNLAGRVRTAAAPHALLAGPVYGDDYRGLLTNARCYVHATEVGGTHPALVEAMGAGNLCLVLDTPENREVAGDSAWYFGDEAELAELLRQVEKLEPATLSDLRATTRAAVADRFSWSAVTDSYLRLLRSGAPA